ncbi:MAG: hypothetical protein GC171_09595 [Terrimonas sp.]|nr:hypothetical protein [Terrimonas sp.]
MKKSGLIIFCMVLLYGVKAQDAGALVEKIKGKYNAVKDYEANAKMKTNVVFIKAPVANIKVYYKNPDQLKIRNESGISFIPRGSVNVNMGNIFTMSHYAAIDAGTEMVNGRNTRVIKILPDDEQSDVVLSTLYIDEAQLLVLRSKTTTKENGTYELDMFYGRYANYGLPDKVRFTFNTRDYKLPKGVTFDYDNGSAEKESEKTKDKKGTVEISYSSYSINKGIPEGIFN